MEFDLIIDSHSHWGPSLSMGTEVTTAELQRQLKASGISHVVLIPFPSTAIANNEINIKLLEETKQIQSFIPYHYIRENYDTDGFNPIPEAYSGGKWHWMRGWQDTASNYEVLDDPLLPGLIEKLRKINKPIVFEEDFEFTVKFVNMAEGVTLIIPHLGLLGGNPYDFLRAFKDNESIYFDTALASRDQIKKFVETIGPERVIFGSDVPFGSMASELDKVMSLQIPREDKELLLYKNIINLAKLDI
ncbi:MAG: amidohydrolase family protein [Syntrophorhabdus sp.]|nr:amidohydrolase family protein [Syntrophorhabdus sp.]